MTQWRWRLYLFIPASANTPENRQAFAQIFADATGKSAAEELVFADTIMRLSTTGNTPVQAFAINTVAKLAMKEALKTFLATIGQSAWYVVKSGDARNADYLHLIQSNRASVDGLIGTMFTFDDALADLGLQRIDAP